MSGEYRSESALSKISQKVAKAIRSGRLRIALTNQPITGATRREDMSEDLAKEYEGLDGLERYAVALREGSMVPIEISVSNNQRYYGPGELFFTT